MHAPAYASFDGVTGGMILDLSEEGLSMQMGGPFDVWGLDRGRRVRVEMNLAERDRAEGDFGEPAAQLTPSKLETTGYIAWADALGRAGVRFSDLPEDARQRLNEWLTRNAGAPSQTAPKVALGWPRAATAAAKCEEDREHVAISLEADAAENGATENGLAGKGTDFRFRLPYSTNSVFWARPDVGAAADWRAGAGAHSGQERGDWVGPQGWLMCRASVESAGGVGHTGGRESRFSRRCFREGIPLHSTMRKTIREWIGKLPLAGRTVDGGRAGSL